MKQIKNKNKSRIPEFSSREEAKFFETHSISDYSDEFKPIKVRFAKNLSEGLNVRLDPDTLTKIRRKQGIKEWVPPLLYECGLWNNLNNTFKTYSTFLVLL